MPRPGTCGRIARRVRRPCRRIRPYEEQEWARLPEASTAAPTLSLALLDALHARWTAALDGLPEEAFARGYVHPASGPGTLDGLLASYAWHGRHHVAHVTALRAREGWDA